MHSQAGRAGKCRSPPAATDWDFDCGKKVCRNSLFKTILPSHLFEFLLVSRSAMSNRLSFFDSHLVPQLTTHVADLHRLLSSHSTGTTGASSSLVTSGEALHLVCENLQACVHAATSSGKYCVAPVAVTKTLGFSDHFGTLAFSLLERHAQAAPPRSQ